VRSVCDVIASAPRPIKHAFQQHGRRRRHRIQVGDRVFDVAANGQIAVGAIALAVSDPPVLVVDRDCDGDCLLTDGRVVPSWKLCRITFRVRDGWATI
jgi:hypothetical protein